MTRNTVNSALRAWYMSSHLCHLEGKFQNRRGKTLLPWLFFPLSILQYVALCSICTELVTTVVAIFIFISVTVSRYIIVTLI